ncbi:MAG TPA: DUF2950 domain-containing protein [Verrucomicrobiae bacterium]|jgi:hypothetical protein|nr:DUF2950 domain-containing protein [Verrucomicrobiae bacterium]
MKLNFSALRRSANWACGLAVAGMFLAAPDIACAAGEQQFDSPDEAVKALTDAAKARDTNAVHAIFGPEGAELMSPDIVQATEGFNKFVDRLNEKTTWVNESDTKADLEIGNDAWPFPIPLVKANGKWFFDVAAGREEILNRRIGGNELGAMDVCRAYVDAQREYASQDRNGDQVLEYAQHLFSTPGTHDGLYWPAPGENDELSPLGLLVAQARDEGYHHRSGLLAEKDDAFHQQTPYHGYYFKVLTKEGKHAPAGKYCYIVNGHMIGGFALVAWPAEWGNTGIMTFIVNQQGKIYQKNLGKKSSACAKAMTTYDPDSSWTEVTDR